MFLGILIDLGVDPVQLESRLRALPLDVFELRAEPGMKFGIGGTKVTVHCQDSSSHRHLSDIRRILDESALTDAVKKGAIRVFERLAIAEARVHRTDVNSIHFHEVGAMDAIVDIVGTLIGLEILEVTRIFASPVPLGQGFVRCQHGMIPVPVPAVIELLQGVPTRQTAIESEITTPTGAALVTTLSSWFGPMPEFLIDRVGYGLGQRDLEIPNLSRGFLGSCIGVPGSTGKFPVGSASKDPLIVTDDEVVLFETNLDDVSPEICGYLFDVFLARGALDVWITPIQMKKNRPGILISVLAPERLDQDIHEIFFRETTTLGVRRARMYRKVLSREIVEVTTKFGVCRVKRAGGRVHPEYEDCARAAREHEVPLVDIYEEVRRCAAPQI